MSKPPLVVRLIALTLITIGVLSIVEMVVGMTLRRSFTLDFNFLLLFVGRGLLRRSDTARGCASFFLGFACIALAFAFAASLYYLFYPMPPSVTMDLGVTGISIALTIFGFAWKGLRSEKASEWFESEPPPNESRRPFQFRISTLLYCTFLVAVICVTYRSEILFHRRDVVTVSKSFPNGIGLITTGTRRYRRNLSHKVVDFVIIETESGSGGITSSITSRHSSIGRDDKTILTKSDSQKIELPNDIQLYEITDGEFRTSNETVSVSQLEAYIEGLQGRPSLEGLLATPVQNVPKE